MLKFVNSCLSNWCKLRNILHFFFYHLFGFPTVNFGLFSGARPHSPILIIHVSFMGLRVTGTLVIKLGTKFQLSTPWDWDWESNFECGTLTHLTALPKRHFSEKLSFKLRYWLREYPFTRILHISTEWKVSVFRVFLVSIFPHSDWLRRDTE